ncbi:MAG: hypothetical protein K5770_18035 [Lachnospiraceae bacterium]|nr:hypothetical protein [Lachnospiraceae bacterium]
MTTYIATISDTKVRDLLKKLKKEDFLILYYKPDEKQVPIDMICLFSETRGMVEFREYTDDVTVAFEMGKLYGETEKKANAVIEISCDSQVFGKIKAMLGGSKKPKKPSGRKAPAAKKAEPVPEQLSLDMIVPGTAGERTDETGKTDSGKPGRKNPVVNEKKKSAKPEDEERLFDEAYTRFDSLLTSLKTKTFNPMTSKQGIFSALRLMRDESQPFEEALGKSLSEPAKKKFFAEISAQDVERIKEAGLEVMRYDH